MGARAAARDRAMGQGEPGNGPSKRGGRPWRTSIRRCATWPSGPTTTAWAYALTEPKLPEGWQTETFHRLRAVELYATPETARLAGEAYSAAWRWGYKARRGRDDEQFYDDQDAFDTAEKGVRDGAAQRSSRARGGREWLITCAAT